jgi:hypothetical protein
LNNRHVDYPLLFLPHQVSSLINHIVCLKNLISYHQLRREVNLTAYGRTITPQLSHLLVFHFHQRSLKLIFV